VGVISIASLVKEENKLSSSLFPFQYFCTFPMTFTITSTLFLGVQWNWHTRALCPLLLLYRRVISADITWHRIVFYCIIFGAKINSSKLGYNFYFKNRRKQDTTPVTLIFCSFNHLTIKYMFVYKGKVHPPTGQEDPEEE